MIYDQVAIGCSSHHDMVRTIAEMASLGHTFTARDTVTARGRDHMSNKIENVAELAFSYNTWKDGLEHEVLHYLEGFNWHLILPESYQKRPFISHFGVHLKTLGEMDALTRGRKIMQEVVTTKHTNAAIACTRRYHYRILDTRAWLGAELKLIRRLTLEEGETLLHQLVG